VYLLTGAPFSINILTLRLIPDRDMKENSISYKRIFIFFLIAVSLSNIFRFDVFGTKAQLEQLPSWLYLSLSALPEGCV